MNESDVRDEQIKYISYNWFRNEFGIDESVKLNISIGEAIAPIVWQGMANIAYEYHLVAKTKSPEYALPSDTSRISRFVAEKLQKRIVWQDKIGHFHGEETDFLPTGEKHQFMIRIVRTIQLILRKRLMNRYLFIDSRMTRHLNFGQKPLRLFRKSLLSGAFPIARNSVQRHYENALPASISFLNTDKRLNRINQEFVEPFDGVLIELFSSYIEIKFAEMRDGIVESIVFSQSLLNFYRPKSCVMPSDTYPSFIIFAQMCRYMGVNTIGAVDGYPLISICPLSKGSNGDSWLFNKFIAYGEKHRKDIVEMGFPIEEIIMCEPPFKSLRIDNEKLYDCLVFTWFPNVFSCKSDHTSPPNTLLSALRAVIKSGAVNIGIKIKTEIEIEYVKKVISSFENKVHIDVLQGDSITHLLNCEYAVGGISTAATEASLNEIPYLIFEPYENGYSDHWLSKSSMLNPLSLSRSAEHLSEAILKRNSKSQI
jgi:hypothetical protein